MNYLINEGNQMKIDIRDASKIEAIDTITFAIDTADEDQNIHLGDTSINIDCTDMLEGSDINYPDIPNLIKALQKVCELKGIK